MQQNPSTMRVIQSSADRPITQVKTCPRCGARLFSDMDVCYGCLYDFTRSGASAPVLPDAGGMSWVAGTAAEDEMPPVQLVEEPATYVDEMPLDECWDAPADQTACLSSPELVAPAHVGLVIRSSSMDVMLPLGPEGITVGRGDDNDVVLHMRTVSRCHLQVVPQGEGVLVIDQGAINLAFANGLPVEGQCLVGIGGGIDICGVRMGVVGLDR